MAKSKKSAVKAAPPERTPREVKKLPVPASFKRLSMGACIDQLYKWEREVDAAQQDLASRLKGTLTQIAIMRQHILDSFKVSDLQGAKGKLGVAEIKQPVVPSVKDWDAVYAYIYKHKAWGLLHKRIATEAWRERIDAKEPIPGIDAYTPTLLSIKKR